MAEAYIKLEPDEMSWRSFIRAVRDESDGKEILRELRLTWGAAVREVAAEQKGRLRAGIGTRSHHPISLRSAILAGHRTHVYMGGASRKNPFGPGVAIKAHRRPTRDRLASRPSDANRTWRFAQLMNAGKRWKHYAWGRPTGKTVGFPALKGWFDEPWETHRPVLTQAVHAAYRHALDRISRKSRG